MLSQLDIQYFVLLFARIVGCLTLNPVTSRKGLPLIFRAGLCLFLTIAISEVMPYKGGPIGSLIEYAVLIVMELLVGYVLGFVMNLFFAVINIGGEIGDMQLGMAMAKMYDPQSNVSMGVYGSFFNLLTMFLFFACNGHITLIQIIISSCDMLSVGSFTISPGVFYNVAELFQLILIYSLKFSMPIMVVEIIAESGIGIMMKAIPQIQVFTVNIQLKIILGMMVMFVLIPVYSSFLETLIRTMFEAMQSILGIFM